MDNKYGLKRTVLAAGKKRSVILHQDGFGPEMGFGLGRGIGEDHLDAVKDGPHPGHVGGLGYDVVKDQLAAVVNIYIFVEVGFARRHVYLFGNCQILRPVPGRKKFKAPPGR
jgi:hypothetical protein